MLSPGYKIIEKGHPSEVYFFIQKGKININQSVNNEDGHLVLQTIKSGEVFCGLNECSFEAASKQVLVFRISKEVFHREFPGYPTEQLVSKTLLNQRWLE